MDQKGFPRSMHSEFNTFYLNGYKIGSAKGDPETIYGFLITHLLQLQHTDQYAGVGSAHRVPNQPKYKPPKYFYIFEKMWL